VNVDHDINAQNAVTTAPKTHWSPSPAWYADVVPAAHNAVTSSSINGAHHGVGRFCVMP
jgi:hypothetical protein